MLELVIVLAVLYGLSVLVSFGLVKLIFDDIPAKYTLIPVLNVVMPFVDLFRGRTGHHPRRTPKQELDRQTARHHIGARPWWPL